MSIQQNSRARAVQQALHVILVDLRRRKFKQRRKLNQLINLKEERYTMQEKEMTAAGNCLRVWRQYKLWTRFIVKIDKVAIS